MPGHTLLTITHADADVIDPLDCDGLGHCELRAFADIGHLIWKGSGRAVQRYPSARQLADSSRQGVYVLDDWRNSNQPDTERDLSKRSKRWRL
jgi:hypothetical protein